MKMFANLHTHSTHSDGPYSPGKIVKVAKDEGYKAIALADHDIATGYDELLSACKKENMDCILGAEFSVDIPHEYHITAYGFDPGYPQLKKYFEDMAYRRTYNTLKCFEEAVALGNIRGITWDEVLEFNGSIRWLCNNHVFEAMKSKGLVRESDYYKWFKLNFEKQRAKYTAPVDLLPLPELVAMVKRAGGIALVAHPRMEQLACMDELIDAGIQGLEVWSADMALEEREKAYKIGIERNLFISGGSDHSGLCGGYYSSYKTEEELKNSEHYIEPLSVGTTEHFYNEIKEGKIRR